MMRVLLTICSCLLFYTIVTAQGSLPYEPSSMYPYGLPNPSAGTHIQDWSPLIGTCECKSVQRNQDGTWQDTIDMTWIWKYILNGTAVQDISLKDSSLYATSIRQFHPDSNQWIVTFFSFPGVTATPGTWIGGKQGNDMVLSQPQKAPNGMDGFSKLTFYDIRQEGYRWKGEWVKDDGSITYPFWSIDCIRP